MRRGVKKVKDIKIGIANKTQGSVITCQEQNYMLYCSCLMAEDIMESSCIPCVLMIGKKLKGISF